MKIPDRLLSQHDVLRPRMPAEWERHRRTWVAWPHNRSDWPGKMEAVRWCFTEMVRLLTRSEAVAIVCNDANAQNEAITYLRSGGINEERITWHFFPTDRSWVRDSMPTAVFSNEERFTWISWLFTGWEQYPDFIHDQNLGKVMSGTSGSLLIPAVRPDTGEQVVLEGGCIDTNGAGLLMATEQCLLSKKQQRNPGFDKKNYMTVFSHYLGITQVIWLGAGCAGDDTHGHVDNVARFITQDTVVISCEKDPLDENYATSIDNLHRLERATTPTGQPLRIVTLPFPQPVYFDGDRLPASYANFYIANASVIVPLFNDPNDLTALNVLTDLFPGREVIGLSARDLLLGGGAFHCLTQPEPLGEATAI